MKKKGRHFISANDSYSRNEIDLKLENLEQRLDNKLNRVLSAIEILSNHVDTQVQDLRVELGWVKTLLISSNLGILIALGGVILPIAWVLWSFAVHFPGEINDGVGFEPAAGRVSGRASHFARRVN